ncbi:OmpP1/FadL family transporter [Pseudoduganella plicata]|uniref:Outer membrane protein n=1 Tax=Pseudoduganella plicata TaxID=321984 RepID=A0A4P7BMN2_9BURK|nr:OmpP1/FadL family transporter [Pseudoduganella plicata]QBQ38889.1 transporter [Pseudoduganella plicata]GGZ09474.1 putative outer membrane protein [Pseudoduganella plicata]
MTPKYLTLIIAAALSAVSVSATASGYRFGSQSVSSQGTAEANGAEAGDASTIFANPAGMARLEGRQIMGGVTAVVPHSTFNDEGSTRFTRTSTGGLKSQDDYVPGAVAAPSLYYTQKVNDQWTAGFGMFVPYGTNLSYDWNWAGRYALTNIKLTSVNLNPSIAFKPNEHHAFGFGLNGEFMKASLGQGVDVPGSVAASQAAGTGAALLRQIVAAGGNPAVLANVRDGHATVEGKDWGFGFNLGYMYMPTENTRFGIAYRSSIKHELKGSAGWDFSGVTTDAKVNAILQAASHHVNSAALVELRTPETLSLNGFHQFNDRWAGMFDVTWTKNSRMQNIDIQFPGTESGDEVIRQQWKNTVRVALGANYKVNDNVTLRGGIAHDDAPIRSDELRHAALPDADRVQLSFGANWKVTPNSSIDLAYSYLDFSDARANYTNQCRPGLLTCTGNGETTRGTWSTHMSLVGLSYNYKF